MTNIEQFAKSLAPRLTIKRKLSKSLWTGEDLMLTGVKEVDGEPLKKDKVYGVNVPTFVSKDQESAILRAWRRGRKPAVRKYLKDYLDRQTLNKVMKLI